MCTPSVTRRRASSRRREGRPATVARVRFAVVSVLLGASVALEFAGISGTPATNMEAVIESVSPRPADDVRVEIIGGEAYVRIRSEGTRVVVRGYEDEEYLRIDTDGSTWVNTLSRTRAINAERYGRVSLDGEFSTTAEKWVRRGSDGSVMWHDHRVHWMNPDLPPATDARGLVQTFEVVAEIDGSRTVIAGSLYLRPMAATWWWTFALVGVAGALLTSRARRVLEGAVVASVASVSVGAAQFAGLPHGARVVPMLLALGMSAGALAVAGALGARTRLHRAAFVASACAALFLAGWTLSDHVRSRIVPGLAGWEWTARVLVPLLIGYGAVGAVEQVAVLTGRTRANR